MTDYQRIIFEAAVRLVAGYASGQERITPAQAVDLAVQLYAAAKGES